MNSKLLKTIALALTFAVSFGLCAFAEGEETNDLFIAAPAPSFTDLADNDWAFDDIIALSIKGIIAGGGDGLIRPSDAITRQEAAKLLVEVRGFKNSETADMALDVKDPESVAKWAAEYVAIAMNKNILQGNTEGEVKGNAPVSRAELATMIVRSIGASTDDKKNSSFTDVTENMWYAQNVECAKTLGIVTGFEDGTFRGDNTVTRREAFVMLNRLVKLLEALEA